MAERAQITVKGVVQGVGFRPYVYTLASGLDLKGYVTNTAEGVLIDVEGTRLSDFLHRLPQGSPPLSRIAQIAVAHLPLHGYADFTIRNSIASDSAGLFTLVSPDVSICPDCLRELFDPRDRRRLYPFINCMHCGPRYSITKSVPYDRPNTTMASFTLCPECEKEYRDPRDRRFHAQPNACPKCGPQVEFGVSNSECGIRNAELKGNEALAKCIGALRNGGIVAIKGIGGFHIACDAMNEKAVRRLRERKRKSNKPFGVMMPDVETIRRFCEVSEAEREVLESGRRPIVLLRKKSDLVLSHAVSPDNNYLGCMLPYTPLHYLLFYQSNTALQALVMTSGNLSEEPIVHDNEEAFKKLSGIVDGFLVHNRDIFMRVDDSVIRIRNAEFGMRNNKNDELRTHNSELSFIRRSRGYAPEAIPLHDDGPEVLGCGADLKNTFTLTKGGYAIPSQHIGDMENYETLKFFEECLENLKAVYRVDPVAIVHDLHPGYMTTKWAFECGMRNSEFGMKAQNSELRTTNSGLKRYALQHHYAHIGSVMAEHGLREKVIGVAFDGTGYGIDGNLWGGEFLIADIDGFERVGQFKYIPLPGGEAAIREPWRTAISYIADAAGEKAFAHLEQCGFVQRYGKENVQQIMTIARSKELSPLSSGAGRLFDAVSAMLGICDVNSFEGEAAMALESYVQNGIDGEYQVELKRGNGYTIVDFSRTVLDIFGDLTNKIDRGVIATRFHNTIASVIRSVVGDIGKFHGIADIALSGGAFQNLYLLNRTAQLLKANGLNVHVNQKVPCNDAGISLGQAYIVRERLKKCF
jgi:hydrogenase maturation protein HypF